MLLSAVIVYWFAIFIDFDVIVDNEKVTLWVHAPSTVEEDESFEVCVQAWDEYERLAGGYNGEISFELESYNMSTLKKMDAEANLPKDAEFTSNFVWKGLFLAYKFDSEDNGMKRFEVSITTPGIHYIVVKETDEMEYRSNPIVVFPKDSDFDRLVWGDIHGHSQLSDGSGSPEEVYEYARDVALVDFAALTDHAEMFPRFGDVDLYSMYENYIKTTNSFNEDGSFATIVAVEYTPMLAVARSYLSPSHINVYFEGDDMPYFSSFNQVNPDELYEFIEEKSNSDFVAWSHHGTRNSQPTDFGYYYEDINTMYEIYSCHGSCEVIGEDNPYTEVGEVDESGYSLRDALTMGRKLGIMSSSDSHDGKLGHANLHTKAKTLTEQPYSLSAYQYGVPYPGGITGLFISKLTREKVFNALKNRSGYATTWINRHYINFSINGVTVGMNDSTVIVPSANSTRSIEILVAIDGLAMEPDTITKLDKIEIIKNSEVWKTYEDIQKVADKIQVNDTSEIKGTEYEDCVKKDDGNWYINSGSIKSVDLEELNTDGADYYYLRIADSNGGAAWIGPIWVKYK